MLATESMSGWVEYYNREAQRAHGILPQLEPKTPKPKDAVMKHLSKPDALPEPSVSLRAPRANTVFALPGGVAKRYYSDNTALIVGVEQAHLPALLAAGCLPMPARQAPPGGTVLKASAPYAQYCPAPGILYVAGVDSLIRDISAVHIAKLVKAGCEVP